MAYNINAAVATLNANSSATSKHMCAKYVRIAMEAGGLSTAGRPGIAREYVNFLPKIGYQYIATVTGKVNQANWSNSSAQPGDISVMQNPSNPSAPGHICMWNGSQWISDFRQNNMFVYSGDHPCWIFRYTGEISNEPFTATGDFSIAGGVSGTKTYKIPECPSDIKFKRLWNMYREKSAVFVPGGAAGTFSSSGVAGFGGDVSSITDEMVSYLGLETKEGALFLLNSISQFEGGLKWTDSFGQKEINGYGDTSDNPGHHRTFAFGMLYDPESSKFMDEVIPAGGWTEDILRRKFLYLCAKHVRAIKTWKNNNNVNISEEWFVALCHFHHWSPSVPNGHRDPYWDCLSNPFRWLAGDVAIRQRYPNYQDALWSVFTTSGRDGGERRNSKYCNGWKRRYYDFQLEHAK